MKKVLFTVALMFGAFAASAQQSVVKEAKGLMKKDPTAAAQKIEAALTNPETANDPNTWQLAGDIQKAIYDAENDINYMVQAGIEKNKTADLPKMFNSLLKMFDYYMKCDEVEQAKVASGELKKAKLRNKNVDALLQRRPNLAYGGSEAFGANDYVAATKFFGTYVDVVESPMFEAKVVELKADTLYPLYATYAAMSASLSEPKNLDAIIKYGAIGKADKKEGWKGLLYMSEAYKEKGDTIKWLDTVKEGVSLFPEIQQFIGGLMDYYLSKGMIEEALAEIDKQLAVGKTPFLLHVKSVLLNEKRDYEGAMAVADEIIAIGGEFQAEAYAMKGNCYYNPAQLLLLENNELSLEDPKYNANLAKIKDAYAKAMPFYEQAQKLAPQNTALWGNPLLRIYYDLNKATEYDILSKELGY